MGDFAPSNMGAVLWLAIFHGGVHQRRGTFPHQVLLFCRVHWRAPSSGVLELDSTCLHRHLLGRALLALHERLYELNVKLLRAPRRRSTPSRVWAVPQRRQACQIPHVTSGKRHFSSRSNTIDNDSDNDHSSSQVSVHQALTCPEGQSAWALASSLFGEKFSS